MKIIEIDDEVYSHLLSQAIPYEDKTPNDTIRRLFGFDRTAMPTRLKSLPQRGTLKIGGRKRPKASLLELVNAGVLEEGQKLRARDYRGREIPDSEATIHLGGLLKDGVSYSMTYLAKELFKRHGYKSDAVRGPLYWFTENDDSIKKLWDKYLEKVT
jgi:hypothetical protein